MREPTYDHADDDLLARFRSYWDAKRGEGRLPSRRDIDPLEFAYALTRVSIIRVLQDPLRFRFALVGSQLTDNLGYELTGRSLEEVVEPELRDYLRRQYLEVLASRRPYFSSGSVRLDGRTWTHRTLVLPLAGEDRRIDNLLTCQDTAVSRPVVLGVVESSRAFVRRSFPGHGEAARTMRAAAMSAV